MRTSISISVTPSDRLLLEGARAGSQCAVDLAPFMAVLSQGYNPQRVLIVRLQGADYELHRTPPAAAMPKVNATAPVSHATRSIFHRSQRDG